MSLPVGSLVVGTCGIIARPIGESRFCGMILVGIATPVVGSLIVPDFAEKSPVRSAAVGTKAVLVYVMLRRIVRCHEPKKKSLSFLMGPPSVPPNWLRLSASFCVPKKLRAFSAPLRRNSKALRSEERRVGKEC